MIIETERLILRPWLESDAESLFECAKDKEVGPSAGWPIHRSVEESLMVIKQVFNGPYCFAICEKDNNIAIGAIELMLKERSVVSCKDDECELGYWLGKNYWGNGYVPEASKALIQYAFENLNMETIWCCRYEENIKSKRVQEKLGFVYHHKCDNVPVPLLNEIRNECVSILTKSRWLEIVKM